MEFNNLTKKQKNAFQAVMEIGQAELVGYMAGNYEELAHFQLGASEFKDLMNREQELFDNYIAIRQLLRDFYEFQGRL